MTRDTPRMGIVYLACPYSKGTLAAQLARYEAATHVAAKLIEQRLIVFSPITMTHPIDVILAKKGETLGSHYWVEFDIAFMEACSELMVLTLPGWNESSGVAREMKFFQDRGLAVQYLEPSDYLLADDRRFRAALK